MTQHKQLDVLAVGDVVTDAFVKLLDDQAKVTEHEGQTYLTMPFGTKVPYDHALVLEGVGNAANAAVSFSKLGLHAGLVSNVGGDDWGRDVLRALSAKKVDTRFTHINPGKVTNYHYVLWYKAERTILIKHEEYEYHWPRFRAIDVPKWVYFSSISKNALGYHDQLTEWLNHNPEVKLAFQPGTFQMEYGVERLKHLYARTEVVILNREEAVRVTDGDYDNLHDLLDRLHGYGPKIAVVTDGPHGAYASDGANRYKMPNYPDPAPPVERTGAGDSFASTLVAAIMKGATLETALLWAPINSMNVVQHVGAQEGLLNAHEIDHYLRAAPDWYHPERLN